MKGAANVSLPIKEIKKIQIPLPTIKEQQKIIKTFNNIDLKQTDLSSEITCQQALLKKLCHSILQEAIEGKLTVDWRKEHPDAEPASELLKKIKAEKEKLVAEGKTKKQKPLPEIKEEEKHFDLPYEWVWCRLGKFCSKIGSGSTPRGGKSTYSESGVYFFRSQNIYNKGLNLNDIVYVTKEIHNKMSGTKVLPLDTLLNITGGSIGRASIVPSNFTEANVSQHVTIIRPLTIYPFYLHKVILSPFFQTSILNAVTGAGREGLPKYNLETILFPLPPLVEQKAIVAKVEKLLAYCDRLEEQINNSKENSEQLMHAVLKEAFAE